MTTLPDILRFLRHHFHLSHDQVAQGTGISVAVVLADESHAGDPTVSRLHAYADMYGTTPWELLRQADR